MNALQSSIDDLKKNDRQWEAFTATGHVVVTAPPGSGKTKLLSTRIAYDLESLAGPQGVAGITLTNAAAGELRRRVNQLGVSPRANLFLGTVHSFVLRRVLLPFAEVCGQSDLVKREVATRKQINRAFREAIDLVYEDWEDTRGVQTTVQRHRKMLADENEWMLAGGKIRAVASQYDRILAAQHLTDFDTLISSAVDIVQSHTFVRNILVAEYPRIYVDEYQDLAPGLDRIIRLLCLEGEKRSQLFAVGDHDQAIYGWTGTRPELLHELSAHPAVRQPVRLTTNYRCARKIIDHASLLLGIEGVEGVSDGGQVQSVYCRAGARGQAERAADLAEQAIAEGTPAHEVGIFCPTSHYSQVVVDVFRRRGIPVRDNASPYSSAPVALFVEKLAAWVVHGEWGAELSFSELIAEWRYFLRGELGDLSIELRLMQVVRDSKTPGNEPAFCFLERLLESGLNQVEQDPAMAEDASALAEMVEAFEGGGELADWRIADLADRGMRDGRVAVYTVASCKGLEFDVSMILGADEGMMPHFTSLYDDGKLAEDRRKFYVAVTRSRYKTCIFYSGFPEWASGKKGRMSGPSRFLREMGVIE
ncbi:UvrD-helicase domain-containing protein [Streptomyces sp. NPDC003344]|uniref:UvrD-helicase domain-containing protein n=1 Tax=Streptomyces sp. NPDC003344 TaxID=3364682 RepID=UPI0036CAB697